MKSSISQYSSVSFFLLLSYIIVYLLQVEKHHTSITVISSRDFMQICLVSCCCAFPVLGPDAGSLQLSSRPTCHLFLVMLHLSVLALLSPVHVTLAEQSRTGSLW